MWVIKLHILLISFLSTLVLCRSDQIFSSTCRFDYKNQSFGILITPVDVDDYSCSWNIEVTDGMRIALSIRSLYLEEGDSLTITEFKTIANSTLIHRKVFDKDNKPDDVIFSSSNKLKVDFFENNSGGVRLLHSGSKDVLSPLRKFSAIFEVENCGGVLTLPYGVIEVPTYVHLSMKSHECTWRIRAPEDKVISLSFLTFEVGPGSCLFNMLYIRDGLTSLSDLIGSYCEEYPPLGTIRSSSNGLTITYRVRPTFLASKINLIPRIKMTYTIQENCGGLLESFSGSFTSPSSAPAIESPCIWSLKVSESNHVLLTIKSFQMNIINETGLQESLKVYDGLQINTSLIWSSQWLKPPPPSLFSDGRLLTVSYSTTNNANSTVRLGFKISFRAVHDRMTSSDRCRTFGANRLFRCDDNQYVLCDLVCNGVQECENGLDEDHCLVHYSQIEVQEQSKKAEVGYLVLSFALFGSAVLACMLFVAIDRLCRSHITNLIKEGTGNGVSPRIPRAAPPHSPSLLPQYCDLDLSLGAPPCYEEAIATSSGSGPQHFEAFDVTTGRGYCQSPIGRDENTDLVPQTNCRSAIDIPER